MGHFQFEGYRIGNSQGIPGSKNAPARNIGGQQLPMAASFPKATRSELTFPLNFVICVSKLLKTQISDADFSSHIVHLFRESALSRLQKILLHSKMCQLYSLSHIIDHDKVTTCPREAS